MKKFKIAIVALLACMSLSAQAEELEKGFKGIAEVGYVVGMNGATGAVVGDIALGGQINKYLFLGAGAGFDYFHKAEVKALPIFADVRGYVPLEGSWTPYLDLRGGYAVIDASDYYLSFTAGIRKNLGEKSGLTLGTGYQRIGTLGSWAIKVGIEF